MALLVFPTSPFNGQVYPPNPLTGQNVYQWDAAEQTWRLLGAASGVITGTYGSSLSVGQFTVDAAGRITFAQNVPIQKSSKTQLGVVQIGNNIDVDVATGIISIPFATTGLPGVVIVGSNLSVTAGGILSVPNASTTTPGAVQLVNNTVTNDPSKALTAAAGYTLQQQINALVVSNNLTFAGTINANGGLIASVTPEGAAVGFAIGQPLPSPTPARDEYFVVVTTPGTFTPTGGSTPISAVDGDWFVAIDGVWTYFNIGPDIPRATFVPLDDISGDFDGAQTIFTLSIGGAPYTPGTEGNVLISLGGVLQIPGESFTVVGDSIDFLTTPPAADTTFLGYALSGVGGSGGIAGTGTVTQVNTGVGLTGGPITTSGIISVAPATVANIGGVKPDNSTIVVSPTGVISAVAGAAAGTLQQVTDNGATTTNAIAVGGLTSTGNVVIGDSPADTVTVLSRVASALVPNANEVYDLGLPTSRWRDLYISSNSIYMGTNELTVSGGQLLLNGTPVGGGGSVGTLQTVTNNGATTTNTITINKTGSTDPALDIVGGANSIPLRITAAPNKAISILGSGNIEFLSGSGGQIYSAIVPGFESLAFSVANGPVGGAIQIDGAATRITNQLIASGLRYPITDGTPGQVLTTDGSGNLSWASGSGAIGTLQQVTTLGNTTTDSIRLFDSVTTNEAITLDPLNGVISILPQGVGEPGLYLSPNGATIGNSVGSFSSAGLFPCELKFNGSAGAALKTYDASYPIQLWAGGTNLVGAPQVSVTGTATTVTNQLIASGLRYPIADGTSGQVLTTDGVGNLGWLATAEVVAVPANSGAGGAAGQIAFGNGFFYWFDPTGGQWLRVAGSSF